MRWTEAFAKFLQLGHVERTVFSDQNVESLTILQFTIHPTIIRNSLHQTKRRKLFTFAFHNKSNVYTSYLRVSYYNVSYWCFFFPFDVCQAFFAKFELQILQEIYSLRWRILLHLPVAHSQQTQCNERNLLLAALMICSLWFVRSALMSWPNSSTWLTSNLSLDFSSIFRSHQTFGLRSDRIKELCCSHFCRHRLSLSSALVCWIHIFDVLIAYLKTKQRPMSSCILPFRPTCVDVFSLFLFFFAFVTRCSYQIVCAFFIRSLSWHLYM